MRTACFLPLLAAADKGNSVSSRAEKPCTGLGGVSCGVVPPLTNTWKQDSRRKARERARVNRSLASEDRGEMAVADRALDSTRFVHAVGELKILRSSIAAENPSSLQTNYLKNSTIGDPRYLSIRYCKDVSGRQ
ncbi:PREDICTED: uncharacterized protein LOC106742712 [Dinoponera quadriceps]|uniref:Uncharacterized protein LOC106742712 n=1 Tax=Dinoponera quadriceps TaxID=609295 RepID=A0A6P3WZP9_DINQU|nr:PREDICTED: uncharacterized protein LOC106742712 [Dinoponera quadriceps]XP_014471397.1 PREDICTED: uncharacterized protein LOC106742712 [Dinoponera quadriceps]